MSPQTKHTLSVIAGIFWLMLPIHGALTDEVPGPGEGPDEKLEAMEPAEERVNVGLAGEYPANIARYLLAQGAQRAVLSPDGNHVAVRSILTGLPQIWVNSVDGGQPRQLTFGNGVTFFEWAPDGQSLFYGADNDGDEQEAYYRISLDGQREERILAARRGAFRSFGGTLPDGETIVFSSTERNGTDYDIYRLDLATGMQRMMFEGELAWWPRSVSPFGPMLLMTQAVGEDSNNLFLLNLDSGEKQELSVPDRRANTENGGFAWTADGRSVYHASNEGREFLALIRRDLIENQVEVVEEAPYDIENVCLGGSNHQVLLWTTNEDGFSRLHARDLDEDRTMHVPELPEGVYSISCPPGSPRAAILVNGHATPGDVLVWDFATGSLRTVWESNLAGLDPSRLVRPESLRMPARDGVTLQGLLYLPSADQRRGKERPPVVFDVHGGPTAQSQSTFQGNLQYLLEQGIAVFRPNIRGSTGFGHTYLTLDDREKRLDSIRDLVDMLQFLRDDGRVDADRAIVRGGSYGGYAVNAVLANHPGHFIAGVSLFGVADWVTALEVAAPSLRATDLVEYGDIREPEWREFYSENSPIRQADRIQVPVLYSHGVNDTRVDIHETEVMVRVLRNRGIEAPYIRFRDEGHGWRRLSNRLFYGRREAEFIEKMFGLDGPEEKQTASSPLRFEKRVLTERYFCDGITAGDINRDGHIDIVAGPYWYEGPDWTIAHEFYPAQPLPPEASPSNSMFSFVYDLNGNGWLDILVLGRVHMHSAYWYENPGETGETGKTWKRHFAFERVRGESPMFEDITGDGRPELLCHWEGRWGWIAPDWEHPTEPWQFHPLGEPQDWDQFYHGQGIGDVNGNGRQDVILNDGWYEQPESLPGDRANAQPWRFHRYRFSPGRGGAQMFVDDVSGNGRSDIITALDAHGWGLAWFEQLPRSNEADIRFRMHRIMGSREEEQEFGVAFSQPHALALADLDGDGLNDIVVGKRRWAHGPTGDVEPDADPVLYWFQLQRDEKLGVRYIPHRIDDYSGVGVQITVMDVDGDGRPDILTASKLGTFVFLNRPSEQASDEGAD